MLVRLENKHSLELKRNKLLRIKRTELKKLITEEVQKAKNNPWAICTAQVGRSDKQKYEKCVLGVKKGLKEEEVPDTEKHDELDRIVSDHIELIVDEVMHSWLELSSLENPNVWKSKVEQQADKLSQDLTRTVKDLILKKILDYETKLKV